MLWRKKGAQFEDLVAYVYQSLLDLEDYSSIVSKHVHVRGQDGLEGEIDVYYQFDHLNVNYQVAIECKDWKTAVTAKEVRDFYAKIEHLKNVAGIMISTSGYQSGAYEWAKGRGITLMTADELPTIYQILSKRIEKAFLPDETSIGEPFWVLMELTDDKKNSGVYFGLGEQIGIPLLLSKKTAETLRKRLPNKDNLGVRGLTKMQLRGLLEFAEKLNWAISFCPIPMEDGEITTIPISIDVLREHYLD